MKPQTNLSNRRLLLPVLLLLLIPLSQWVAPAASQTTAPTFANPHGDSLSSAMAPARRNAGGNPVVAVVTPLGNFKIELLEAMAPATVANFLKYVTDGDFANSFIHRSVPGFIVQGGSFTFTNSTGVVAIPADPPVVNEFNVSNLRGTLAMAKLGNDPNSATSGWFVNLADNSENLDAQNGGFTVFGKVLGDGMAVVDAIAAAPIINAGTPFDTIPLINYTNPDPIGEENVIKTHMILGSARGFRPPILLRRTTDRKWFSVRLAFDNTTVATEEGFVSLSRSRSFGTVSRADFDGDGEADVMLRGTRGGKKGRWQVATLSGAKITSKGSVGITRDTDFQIAASGDFDGDGKDDLLLRNVVDGRWMITLLDGKTVTGTSLLDLSTDLADKLVGTGDFNGDGRTDVLLQRANGSWLMYTLDGLAEPVVSMPKLSKGRKWSVQAVADFNGDGCADVLLRHSKKGRWQMFILRGPDVIQKGAPKMSRDRDFSLQSHADFDGDGIADALLRSTDGSWFLYSLSGPTVGSNGSVDMTDDTAFQIAAIGDFNADGKADALLRHTDGSWLLYGLDGRVPTVLGSVVPPIDDSTTWVLQVD